MCVSLMYIYIYMTQNLALKFIRKDHFTQKLQFYNTMLFAEITFVAFYFHNICLFDIYVRKIFIIINRYYSTCIYIE